MSAEVRCRECGALLASDAEWCGQCYTPVPRAGQASEVRPLRPGDGPTNGAPSERTPAAGALAPSAGALAPSEAIRREGDAVLWTCPSCELENPVEASACARCGTPFTALLVAAEPETPPPPPGRALGLALAFPGLGQIATGRAADGVARIVLFVWAVGLAVMMLFAGRGSAAVRGVGAIFLLAALGLWVVSVLDARRAAEGETEPILSSRLMLGAVVGLTLLSIAGFLAATLEPAAGP